MTNTNLLRRPDSFGRALALRVGGAVLGLVFWAATTQAGPLEQAAQIHNRIAGVPPSEQVLLDMRDSIVAGDIEEAVRTAMDTETFYSVTLKDMATPWTNRDQNHFAALNDYTATFIGLVRDGADIRTLLYDDIIYVSNAGR